MTTVERFDRQAFRTVMGNYPTGVTVVTAIDDGGRPLGLTIGSFTSVSLDPPLVAFYPMAGSSTFATMRELRGFCVNILAEDQEHICRQFASRQAEKFDGLQWRTSPNGRPILDDAIAWLDCDFDTVVPAGDHYIATGRVTDLAVERDRMPLLFFQGGYGSFLPRSLVASASGTLPGIFQTVDAARRPMEELADTLGVGCLAVSVVNGDLITLASTVQTGSHRVPAGVGARVRWAPPLGAMFVAWAGDEECEHWMRRSRSPLSDVQRAQLVEATETVRERGWSIGLDTESQRTFESALVDCDSSPDDGADIDRLLEMLNDGYEPRELSDVDRFRVRHIGAPVFDKDGRVVLDLHLVQLPGSLTKAELDRYVDAVRAAATALTEAVGGVAPTSLPALKTLSPQTEDRS